jgi:hypothetical protein
MSDSSSSREMPIQQMEGQGRADGDASSIVSGTLITGSAFPPERTNEQPDNISPEGNATAPATPALLEGFPSPDTFATATKPGSPAATPADQTDDANEETATDFSLEAYWDELKVKSFLYWARFFSLDDKQVRQKIVVEVVGPQIMLPANEYHLDCALARLRKWGQRWQLTTLNAFHDHVSSGIPAPTKALF